MTYFSERESGARPRTIEEIGEVPWGGLSALIQAKVDDGSFGWHYPQSCPDGLGPIGTNRSSFYAAMRAETPNLPEHPLRENWDGPPTTVDILDLLEFCCLHVADPTERDYHDLLLHYHLSYDIWDIVEGKRQFTEGVNKIFARNGLAYTLTNEGRIECLGPPVLREELISTHFQSGDGVLDGLLEDARRKFFSPREEIRGEALQELWDAWERLKTTGEGSHKKEQITSLLDVAAGPQSPQFRHCLEGDATELTDAGNKLQIRHFEIGKEKIHKNEHIDYLFHRLFSLVHLILRTKGT